MKLQDSPGRGLRKELNVKTPFDAVEKWYKSKPEILNKIPMNLKIKFYLLNLIYKQVVINNLVKFDSYVANNLQKININLINEEIFIDTFDELN
jgi:hypothetical protein